MGGGGYIISNGTEDIIGLSSGIAAASIAIGAIVSIISFLGCFGAANEKGSLLKTYFLLLIILVILEIAVGAAAYAKSDEVPIDRVKSIPRFQFYSRMHGKRLQSLQLKTQPFILSKTR
jgi:hypothetical protein